MANYNSLVRLWAEAQRNGSFSGRPLSPNTIRTHRQHLKSFFEKLGIKKTIDGITAKNLEKMIYSLPVSTEKCHYSTKINTVNAVKSFVKFLVKQQLKPYWVLEEINAVKPKRFAPVKRVKAKPEQILALLNQAKLEEKHNLMMLIGLTGLCGLRISEALNLPTGSVDLHHKKLLVRGKGNKFRNVTIPPDALPWFNCWEAVRKPHQLYLAGLAYKSASNHLRAMMQTLGIKTLWHGCRRGCASGWAKRLMPLNYIKYALGHASITTTQLYIEADEEDVFNFFYPQY